MTIVRLRSYVCKVLQQVSLVIVGAVVPPHCWSVTRADGLGKHDLLRVPKKCGREGMEVHGDSHNCHSNHPDFTNATPW